MNWSSLYHSDMVSESLKVDKDIKYSDMSLLLVSSFSFKSLSCAKNIIKIPIYFL